MFTDGRLGQRQGFPERVKLFNSTILQKTSIRFRSMFIRSVKHYSISSLFTKSSQLPLNLLT